MAKTDQTPAPRISVLERRLQNPFGEPSAPITFKEPNRFPRWFNAAIITDKIWRAKNKGWSFVYPKDVEDLDQIGGYEIAPAGGYITRGERGREVLMWMPKDAFEQIQMAKTRHTLRDLRDPTRQRAELLEEAGKKLGSQTAELMEKRISHYNTVTDTREILERDPE